MQLVAASVSIWLALSAAALVSPGEGGALGGYICAPPFPPACAHVLTSASRKSDLADCQSKLDDFTQGMRAYRDCLGRKMGEALREANELIDGFRCRTRADRCPGAAGR